MVQLCPQGSGRFICQVNLAEREQAEGRPSRIRRLLVASGVLDSGLGPGILRANAPDRRDHRDPSRGPHIRSVAPWERLRPRTARFRRSNGLARAAMGRVVPIKEPRNWDFWTVALPTCHAELRRHEIADCLSDPLVPQPGNRPRSGKIAGGRARQTTVPARSASHRAPRLRRR